MGSFSVLNNIPSINGINQLNFNNIGLARTMNRLASGKRINTGADDAAGLQIADSLRGNVMALNQAVRNANEGIGYLQIADGALAQITDMLHRMVTLAEQSATGTTSTAGRTALQAEITQLSAEINRLAADTNFNGRTIFAGNTLNIFVGDLTRNSSYISLSINSVGAPTGNVSVSDAAASMLGEINSKLTCVASARGDIGAVINRLQSAINVISTQSQNTLAAESTIRDANVAEEITNLTKFQILAQTGIAALAQANANSQNVLGLLR